MAKLPSNSSGVLQSAARLSRWIEALSIMAVGYLLLWLLRGSTVSIIFIVTVLHVVALTVFWIRKFVPRVGGTDPGLLFIVVVAIYTLFPLAAMLAFDFRFGADADNRLSAISLDDSLVGEIALYTNAILLGFAPAYTLLRKPHRLPAFASGTSDQAALWIGLVLALSVIALPRLLSGETGGGYADEYLIYRALPTVVLQVLNIISSLALICAFGLMVIYANQGRFRMALVLAIGLIAYFALLTSARTQIVLIFGGLLLVYDQFVKRLTIRQLGAALVATIVLFLLAGFVRDGLADLSYVAGRSEFMAVFVTALDMQQLYITGSTVDMNLTLLLSDLTRLVPQQLLPFEKIDPATWYVNTFYPIYADQGGGLAFGMLAESAIGGGLSIALLRGFALGTVSAMIFNYLTKRGSLWRAIIYLWLFTSFYQSFRDTTFTLVGRFVFQFAPGAILFFLLARLLSIGGAARTYRELERRSIGIIPSAKSANTP